MLSIYSCTSNEPRIFVEIFVLSQGNVPEIDAQNLTIIFNDFSYLKMLNPKHYVLC